MVRHGLIVASTVLLAATLCLWPYTHRTAHVLAMLTRADNRYEFATRPGGLEVIVTTHFRAKPPDYDPIFIEPEWKEGLQYTSHPWGGPPPRVISTRWLSKAPTPVPVQSQPTSPSNTAISVLGVAVGSVTEVTVMDVPFVWAPPVHRVLGFGHESDLESSWTELSGKVTNRTRKRVSIPL